jgi:hypothetical protein
VNYKSALMTSVFWLPEMKKVAILVLLLLTGGLSACVFGQSASPFGENVIFHDEFTLGQMADWQFEGDAQGRTTIVNEQLMVELNAPNLMQFSSLQEQSFADFILQVEVRQLAGDPGNTYGVLFRMQDAAQFYRFELTGDGLYMVERRNADGTWTRFVDDWTESPAIARGINALNRIRVEAIGSNFSLYVNDQLVHQFVDSAYASGTIGLDAGTFVQPHTQALFDNVVVRSP